MVISRANGPASYQPMASPWVTASPLLLRAESTTHHALDCPPDVLYRGLSALGIPWVRVNLGRWPRLVSGGPLARMNPPKKIRNGSSGCRHRGGANRYGNSGSPENRYPIPVPLPRKTGIRPAGPREPRLGSKPSRQGPAQFFLGGFPGDEWIVAGFQHAVPFGEDRTVPRWRRDFLSAGRKILPQCLHEPQFVRHGYLFEIQGGIHLKQNTAQVPVPSGSRRECLSFRLTADKIPSPLHRS